MIEPNKRAAAREKARMKIAAKRAADPEGERLKYRVWREKNKERLNRERRERYLANPQQLRDRLHRHKYGISLAERDALFAGQGFQCASCTGKDPGHKLGWHLDHDHKSGRIRGILCHACNLSLGHAKEDPTRLRALANYIERNQ